MTRREKRRQSLRESAEKLNVSKSVFNFKRQLDEATQYDSLKSYIDSAT